MRKGEKNMLDGVELQNLQARIDEARKKNININKA